MHSSVLAARDTAHKTGLIAIGTIELLKGAAAVFGAIWLLRNADRDFISAAVSLLNALHAAPGGYIAHWIFGMAGKITPEKVQTIAGVAFAYSTFRFVEGYGLVRARVWAEWVAIASCCLYMPFEIYEILKHATALRWLLLLFNIAVLVYLLKLRREAWCRRQSAENPSFFDKRCA